MAEIKISLILCTVARDKEVESFLSSVADQTIDKEQFEIIVCDQNSDDKLDLIINKFQSQINLMHIKSDVKGLSVNRNIGISHARGAILAFPDDDCTYYPDTLETVLKKTVGLDGGLLLGRIYDRSNGRSVLKNWPCVDQVVGYFNFYRLTTSITIFSLNPDLKFDERFGIGAKYPSNEDTLYVLESIQMGSNVRYDPSIDVWHPEQRGIKLGLERVKAYGFGFGKLLRRMPPNVLGYYFILFNLYYCACFIKAAIFFDWYKIKWAFWSLFSRNYALFQIDK